MWNGTDFNVGTRKAQLSETMLKIQVHLRSFFHFDFDLRVFFRILVLDSPLVWVFLVGLELSA